MLSAHRAFAAACFDPFANATSIGGTSYTIGGYLFGQNNGYGNTWFALTNTPAPPATGIPVIAAGNLTYPGIPTSSGNCVFIPAAPGVMGRLTLNFNVTNTGQFYYAFLLNVTNLGAIDSTGTQNNFFAGFGDTVGNQNAALLRGVAKLYAKKSGNGFVLGISRNSNTSTDWVFDSTARPTNAVLLIVASYDYDAHTANLWINPSNSTFGAASPPAPLITATGGADLNTNGIRAFVLGCRTNAPPACLVDDLRIGTSWSVVTGGLDIGTQPVSQTVSAGSSPSFSVVALGTPPLTYQWRKGGTNISDGTKYSGSSTAALTISNALANDAAGYSVIVSSGANSVTSSVAQLTVIDPSIITQPASLSVHPGTNAVFTVVAVGTGPLQYQWYKNGAPLANGGNISGATNATLTIANVSSGDVAAYSVRVINSLSSAVTSGNANLFVSDPALSGKRPNIIYILADDLGYGDMGVLFQNARAAGMPREFTPNLDIFASEGVQLLQNYCPAPLCAPSRASLMLGVTQGHANIRDQQFDKELENNHTLATTLKAAGYATAIIGKWGLGGDDQGGTTPAQWPSFPPKRGFDYFFGYERHADGHEHYPKESLYNNGPKQCWDQSNNITSTLDKCYTADLFAARAKKWITDQKTAQPGQPFFLYLAFDTPHSVYELPTQNYPAGGGLTGGLQWLGTPGQMINTASGTVDSTIHPDYVNATYDDDGNPNTPQVPWPEVFQRYASSVRRIDDAVGDIKQLLKDLNLDSNTIVVFTSDNGPTTEDALNLPVTYAANFFDNFGPMDGVKRDTWEGGIRMPTYVRWPGQIPAGTTNYTPSQFHDWMPTFTDLAGLPVPARSDGVSLLPTLLGTGTQRPSTLYVEYFDIDTSTPTYPEFLPSHQGRLRNQMQVVRLNGYTGVRYNIGAQSDNFEIYDVLHDPKEGTNLALQPAFATLQQQMKDRVLQLRRPDYDAPRPYDFELVPPGGATPLTNGLLSYVVCEGVWPWVPDTAMLTAAASGQTAGLNLAVRTRDTNYAIAYSGYIRIKTDGRYTFYLNTDAGAELRLHGATVIDDDFSHTNAEVSGSILLKAGMHPILLTYRHGTGTNALSLQYSGPQITKQPVPLNAFYATCSNCNVTPLAYDDSAITPPGTPVTINVFANDTDDGLPQPLSLVSVTQPLAGGAVITNGQILYTPNANFIGEDKFTYTITDGAAQDTATVRVEVCSSNGDYWFPFNEVAGLQTMDAAGVATAQLISFTNDPAQWVAGRYNQAINFDGATNEVIIPGFNGVLGAADRSCAAWVKTSSSGNMAIVGWGPTTTGNNWTFLLEGGQARVEVTGGWVQGSRFVNDGQWHYVACTFHNDGSPNATDVKLYVDGTPETTLTSTQSQSINTTSNGPVVIGSDTQGRFFSGVIDEVRVYSRALAASDVATLYSATNQTAAAWATRYFGETSPDWNADLDGDGASLWTEYAFGGQPFLADTAAMRISSQIQNGHLLVQYNRRTAGTTDLQYALQSSPDLKSWNTMSGVEISALPSGVLSGFQQVVFQSSAVIAGQNPLYVRVVAQTP